jgi:hypothetical protein
VPKQTWNPIGGGQAARTAPVVATVDFAIDEPNVHRLLPGHVAHLEN